jgi:Zn-dependent protease with chaperone function
MKLRERIKMELLIFTGRFYFAFILSFVIAALAIIVTLMIKESRISSGTIKIAIFLGLAALGILRGFVKALFLKLPKPEGILASREDYEQFYRIIEEIRTKTDSPKIDFIMFTADFNAAIVERPSFGIFGLYKRYLVIGVPLILSLSEEELKAVIAHECGHLSKAHGKWGVRLYRATQLWESIAREFEKEKSRGSFLVNWFITRYLPALNSMYYSMSKNHEYEADRISLKVVDKQTFANALAKTSLYGYFMDSMFWPQIGKLNISEDKPIDDVYFRMENEAQKGLPHELTKLIFEKMLSHRSLPCSTHPSYIERIEAINAERPNVQNSEESALRTIFKDKSDKMLDDMSQYWCSSVNEGWCNFYSETRELKNKLAELNRSKQLTAEEAEERSNIIERLEGSEKALEAFKQAKDNYKGQLSFEYNIGRLLSYEGNKEGVEMLEHVMEEDPQMIPDCCYHIVNYYCSKSDKPKAAEYYDYAVEFMKTHEDVEKEREVLKMDDLFIPHDLSSDTINELRQELLKYEIIKKAYIVVKYAELSGQFPIYVIGIEFKFSPKKERNRIRQELAEKRLLLWDYWVVELSGLNKKIQYNMDKVDEARIV